MGNYSQDIGTPVLYLIHSVLLDSILTAKALGIICGTERCKSHTGVKMLEMDVKREQGEERPEDREMDEEV